MLFEDTYSMWTEGCLTQAQAAEPSEVRELKQRVELSGDADAFYAFINLFDW